jgi:glycosyltransferase involved in cell wall biosynthesis
MRFSHPSCSVIICTRNRADDLRKTLNSVASLTPPAAGRGFEMIVVDNDSVDHTEDVVTSFARQNVPVRYVHEPRVGKSYALNTALAASCGDILLCTDDDVRLPSNWIGQMCEPIVAGRADAVAGGVRIAPHLSRPWMSAEHRAWLASTEQIEKAEPDEMFGANMAYSRHVLARVPGYDTNLCTGPLGNFEDVLFSRQLRAAGYRIAPGFHCIVEHHFDPARLQRGRWIQAARSLGRSMAYMRYHWWHTDIEAQNKNLVRKQLRLAYWRLKRFKECLPQEGISAWEMWQILDICLVRQYLCERRRPRLYSREGLRKLEEPLRQTAHVPML